MDFPLHKTRQSSFRVVLCSVVISVIISGFAAPLAVAQVSSSAEGLEPAIHAFEGSDLPRAEALVKEYLAAHPNSAAAWNLQGLICDSERRLGEGGQAFREALRLAPSASVYNNLGNHDLLTSQFAEASKNFRQALQLDPHHFSARLSLISLLTGGQFCPPAAAKTCAQEALSLFSGFATEEQKLPEVNALRVRALLGMGRSEEALAAAKSSLTAATRNAQLAYTLGREFQKAGNNEAAADFFQRALNDEPKLSKNFNLRLGLATARYLAHQPSRDDFQELATLWPKAWQPYYYLGRIAEDAGQNLSASTWLVKAQELAPQEPEVAAALANVCARQQFYRDAADEWQRYLKLRPKDIKAYRALAVVAELGQQHSLALESIRQYLAAFSDDAEAQYYLALMEQDAGDQAEARKAVEDSLRLNPSNAPAWTTLGRMDLTYNQLGAAGDALGHALKVNARYVPALVAAAELHIREDHSELALPLLEQAVKIDPNSQTAYYQLTMAYRRTGNAEKAEQAGTVFRRLQAGGTSPRGSRGLLDYLRADVRLSPAERRTHYLQYLKTALKSRPNNPRILARLGVAELEDGETAPALALLRSALQPSLTFSDALASARALTAGSQSQLALEFYDHARKQSEAQKDARPALEEAQLLLSLGHPNQALEILDAVSAQAEPQGRAADLAALILARLGEDSKALAAFRVAISLAPHQPAIYGDTAVFLASRDRWTEALKLLDVAEARCSKSPQLVLNKAILLQLSGHQKDAQEALRSIAFHADDPVLTHDQRLAALLLGISYYTTDQTARAEQIFEGLTRADPQLAQAWYYRALLAPAGNSHEAMEWVNRSLELDPRSAPALYLRAKLLKAANRLREASRDLESAAKLDPQWAPPHYLLSQIYRQEHETASAQRELRFASQINPGDQPTQSSQLRDFLNQLAVSSNP